MRYNRKFIEARFATAMAEMGVKHGETYVRNATDTGWVANVGCHFIDHAGQYGGYMIRVITSAQGGESTPFGHDRYNAREFVAHLDGIIGAARIMRVGDLMKQLGIPA